MRPVALLLAPVMVAVYTVLGASAVAAVSSYVAIIFVASNVTVPVGLAHGAAQVTAKVDESVIGFIGSLKVALIFGLLVGTPAESFAGATAVTVGGAAVAPSVPKI
jgi:hypothetical protein